MSVGLDVGTMFVCSARKTQDGRVSYRKDRDIFVELPADTSNSKQFMDMAGAKLVTIDNKNYAVGEEAVNFSSFFGEDFKRPLKNGMINPSEEDLAIQILDNIIRGVLGAPKQPGELCVFSVPAEPIDEKRNVVYHQKTLEYLIKKQGFTAKPINESLAIVYSELAKNQLTGFGISWGAGLCLSGDTKVPLLNGQIKTMRELSEEYKDKEFWLYSCKEDGQIVPGLASNPRKVKESEVIRIWLDNNKYLDCTPDHKIMMRNGEYREAQMLKENDSIMPLYKEVAYKENKYNKGYLRVKNNKTNRFNFVHRLVASFFNKIPKNYIVHHNDFNKLNNEPNNLYICSIIKHGKLHNADHVRGRTWEQILGSEERSEERKLKLSKSLKKTYKEHPEIIKNAAEKRTIKREERICLCKCGETFICKENSKQKYIHGHAIRLREYNENAYKKVIATRRLKDNYKQSDITKNKISESLKGNIPWNKGLNGNNYLSHYKNGIKNQNSLYNHKITKIEKLNNKIEVYDLSVKDYHNFAIDAGIFVHNCNINLSYKGFPVFAFSVARSGDWIDEQVKQATGKPTSEIAVIKENELDLTKEGDNRTLRYLKNYYEELVDYVLRNIVRKFEQTKRIPPTLDAKMKTAEAIPIVLAGGTSLPKGFPEMFRDRLEKINFPFKISEIIIAKEPLFTVAKGCLISAEAEEGITEANKV